MSKGARVSIQGIGSTWRKWDLHIHTPASIIHHYPGPDAWDAFLTGLASLPAEISVIGINDYLFVDGYERVKEEMQAGRLPNIEQAFPVIELRLDQFVGSGGHWNRVNLHVLFSEQLDAEAVQGQFINSLSSAYQLAEAGGVPSWSGIPSRANLIEFGAAIRSSTPADKRADLPPHDLQLGFGNLVISLDAVQQRLQSSALRGKCLLAVGKAEWEQMSWNAASIASKKHVINTADFSFVAAESPGAFHKARKRLLEQGVRSTLLDCSDAHHLATASQKDRLGNCATWINAEPTFQGLRHALTEYDHRVFIGTEPPKKAHMRERPEVYISAVQVRPEPETSATRYFDVTVPLNPGFVAVVGNKGKGKSALLDIIGHVASSGNASDFSFLNRARFRNPKRNLAAEYRGLLTWLNGLRLEENLGALSEAEERVTYLPQNLIESICSVETGASSQRFSSEIEAVLFSHVPDPARLGEPTLDALIRRRSQALEERLRLLRTDLSGINETVTRLETDLRAEYRQSIDEELASVGRLLAEHMARKPPEPVEPAALGEETAEQTTLNELRQRLTQLDADRHVYESELRALATSVDSAQQLLTAIDTLEQQYQRFIAQWQPSAESLGLALHELTYLWIDREPLRLKVTDLSASQKRKGDELDGQGARSLRTRRVAAVEEIGAIESRLSQAERERAQAMTALSAWSSRKHALDVGTESEPGLAVLRDRLDRLDSLPGQLEELRERRRQKSGEIHATLMELLRLYEEMYAPAKEFIRDHTVATDAGLEFGASLEAPDFETRLWEMIARNVSSSFIGRDQGSNVVATLVERTDFTNAASVAVFLDSFDRALHFDTRDGASVETNPFALIRSGHSLQDVYNYVYGLAYVEVDYSLQASGAPIDQLSPGQRGTLLLMFYLLVDKSERPILLDQPDENLDNQTIMQQLVPAIKEAARRRQIIIVTHSANVAIVADADQLIIADFDGTSFTYSYGAIESPDRNVDAVDILEGTWEAYVNRGQKYQSASGLM